MKIGFFDPYLNTLGGGEKYFLTAASYLSKKHKVSLFWDDDTIRRQAEEKFGFETDKIKTTKNIFVPSISVLQRVLLTQDFDSIFYLSDGSIPLLGSKKLFVHFQFPIQKIKKGGLFDRFKIGRVTRFICNSQFTKSYIDKAFGVKSTVIYPPVEAFSSNTIKKSKSILSVGRFQKNIDGRWVKKQDILIEAFKKIVAMGIGDWELVLAGSYLNEDKKYIAILKKMAEGYPIRLEENISLAKLHKLYCDAKIYWHATGYGEDITKHPERTEHFGISTVEAMQQEAVPVVINAGGQPEIVKDGSNGFLWNSENELIEKTKSLIADTALYSKLQKNAKETALHFTTEKFEEHIENIL